MGSKRLAALPPTRCLIVSWRSWAYRDSIGHRQPSGMSFWRRTVVISPTFTPGAMARCHSASSSAARPRASAVGRSTRARDKRAQDFQTAIPLRQKDSVFRRFSYRAPSRRDALRCGRLHLGAGHGGQSRGHLPDRRCPDSGREPTPTDPKITTRRPATRCGRPISPACDACDPSLSGAPYGTGPAAA